MARQEIINYREFQERFNTEEACREYLFKMRWSEGYVCPKCGCTEYYLISTRNKYQCKNCRYQASVTVGTVMDRSHLSLQTWLIAIYLIARDKRGYSAMQISKELDLPYNTAWFLVHRIRHWLHIIIGNAKAFVLGTYHGLGFKHLQSYLDEFCYRFKRRFFQGEIFSRLLFAVASSSTLRFSDLT